MIKKVKRLVFPALLGVVLIGSLAYAKPDVRLVVTVLVASNEGNDFNLDNDAYRDQLIQLFSYRAYNQVDSQVFDLKKAERQKLTLEGGYELVLTLLEEEKDRAMIQALIRKDGVQYVNTVLSVMKEGVAFLGGPPAGNGALILVLQRD